ncbi:uncharacterized protein [Ambystoma mexicanum]|uniref:uncharacterized protein n=1 Tax=Ambystoma mexicanum TaxID=8296 RepID=UPI0037E8DB65
MDVGEPGDNQRNTQIPKAQRKEHLPMGESHHALYRGGDVNKNAKHMPSLGGKEIDERNSNFPDSEEEKNNQKENWPEWGDGQVSRTNVRKRLTKKRTPKEDSDSEQENYMCRRNRWVRRSIQRTQPKTPANDNGPNSKAISLAQSYLESGPAGTTENESKNRVTRPAQEMESPDLPLATSHEGSNEGTAHATAHAQTKLSGNNTDLGKEELRNVGERVPKEGENPLPRRKHHDHVSTKGKNAEDSHGKLRYPSESSHMNNPTEPQSILNGQERSVMEKLATAFHGKQDMPSEVEMSDSSDTSGIRGTEMVHSSTDARLRHLLKLDLDGRKTTVTPSMSESKMTKDEDRKLKDAFKTQDIGKRAGSVYEEKTEDGRTALQNQITDMLAVLRECDEVDQLVLRNTGMTDDLLEMLTKALIESQSDIETINLNLNNLGPTGARDIVQLLKAKPSLKRLLLFGNQMGDEGIMALMAGLSDLLEKEHFGKAKLQASPTTETAAEDNQLKSLNLIELDIGGNHLTSKGLWSVASFLRMNPPIQYLGLAQSNIESLEGWMEFFDSMKANTNITHLLLDENNLGDDGTRLLADMLKVNQSLCKIDLDCNNIGEEGATAIIESLTTNAHSFLVQVSLDENQVSVETRDKINELLTQNF